MPAVITDKRKIEYEAEDYWLEWQTSRKQYSDEVNLEFVKEPDMIYQRRALMPAWLKKCLNRKAVKRIKVEWGMFMVDAWTDGNFLYVDLGGIW